MKSRATCGGAVALMCLITCGDAMAKSEVSLTIDAIADSDSGSGFDADFYFAPNEHWGIGAGAGKSDAQTGGTSFSGHTLRLNTDLTLGPVNISLGTQQWQDTTHLNSRSTLGQVSWMADNGLSLAALIDDRNLEIKYQRRLLQNQRLPAQVTIAGTGFGGDLGYFGANWSSGIRYMAYNYGSSLDRVRAIALLPTTTEFPVIQALANSVLSRAAGMPDSEITVHAGRTFKHSSLSGEWLWQRDAITQSDINTVALRHERKFTPHLELSTTLGFSRGGSQDTVGFGELALTIRN
jgi:hypothetical protein